jgi:hypothetical protein
VQVSTSCQSRPQPSLQFLDNQQDKYQFPSPITIQ